MITTSIHMLAITLMCILALLIQGCGTHRQSNKIRILATTGIIGDVLRSSLDSNFEIDILMKPGVDPHLYKATAGDVSRMLNADIIVHNGLHLEGKMSEVLHKLSAKKTVIAMSDQLPQHSLRIVDGAHDPHLWFDIELWRLALKGTLATIERFYPVQCKSGKGKQAAYDNRLRNAHHLTDSLIECIPQHRRYLITAHDAFGYFGEAYDIRVIGLQGMSTLSDFGMNDLMKIGELILHNQIRSVFVEMSIAPRSMEALMLNVTSRGGTVSIGGHLYADALDSPEKQTGTYLGMIEHNVHTIVKALK